MSKKIFLLSIVLGLVLASCDFVNNPYPETNANLGDTASCPDATFPTVTSHIKKILIEDYTGHTCGNCPRAAAKLSDIDSIYPGKIVGLAIHAGTTFATPAPGHLGTTPPAFMADYRCPVGDTYDTFFGVSDFGLPHGMFNRKEYHAVDQTHLIYDLNWETYAAGIVAEPSVVDLQISVNYNPATRKICCAVKDSFLTTWSDTLKLVVVLSQDSIVSWQDVYGVVNPNYVHRHMLRDAITPSGAWGESLVTGAIGSGLTHINKFAYTIPASYKSVACDPTHCHLIAFIYKVRTYEIIQVEEVNLIP